MTDGQKRRPLVSVIMPAYNAEPYLEQAVRSVLDQTYENWELLLLDDCSTDRTAALAADLARLDPRIRLYRSEQNLGVARTRNRGFDLAQGAWAALLDSDDSWRREKLERQLALAERTGADILYCSYALVEEGAGHRSDFLVPERTSYDEMLRQSVLSCSTVLLSREIYTSYRFSPEYYHEDYVFWLRLLKDGHQAAACPEVLADYRLVKGSRSDNKLRAAKNRWKIYRRVEGLPFWRAAGVFASYACHGLVKYKRS